jgi:hypothetical protein
VPLGLRYFRNHGCAQQGSYSELLLHAMRCEVGTALKALSVRQPWAELIASGKKTIELRSWSTSYRGPLLICTGKQLDPGWCRHYGLEPMTLPKGVAVCIVTLVRVRQAVPTDVTRSCFPPDEQHYSWELEGVVRVSKQSIVGRLGLFEVTL